MKIIHVTANISILLGSASILAAIFYRALYISWFGLQPRSFLLFAGTCLLLGIALYLRELLPKKAE